MQNSQQINYKYADQKLTQRNVGEMLRPPRRTLPSEWAAEHLYLDDGIKWSPEITPYMVRPMDMTTSREAEAVVFIGPARTGKTVSLVDGRLGHIIANDPADTMVSQMSQQLAKHYSNTRIDRMHHYSPMLREQINLGTQDDNTHDKRYKSGMHLAIGWPSPAQYSSRDFKFVFVTDYDRIPESIGHEGSAFNLVQKRLQTFMSSGMGVYESSPRHEVPADQLDWKPESPHELPPARGITALFNAGTREVFYFQCFDCKDWFVPDFPECFWWPDSKDDEEKAEGILYCCPHCGVMEKPERKSDYNALGSWCGDGQRLDENANLVGNPRSSTIASFRLGAGAAAYQPAQQLARRLFKAEKDYEETGDENGLRGHVGLDQGKPYRPKRATRPRSSDELQNRAENLGEKKVPAGARFIKASIDVQLHHFAVAIIAWGVDNERWIIDRFDIRRSKREYDGAFDVVSPHIYVEDWRLLIPEVFNKKYELDDESGRKMSIKLTCCDYHGADGVTSRAIEFYQQLIRPLGLDNRFCFVRGDGRAGIPRIKQTFPDGNRKDRAADAGGEIPVYQINTEIIKDSTNTDLSRTETGRLYIHLADSLPGSAFEELTAELKDDKQGWINPSSKPNELWDLVGYDRATAITLGVERTDFWEKPPAWARPWDENSLVSAPAIPGPKTPVKPRTPPSRRKLY